MTSEHFLRPSQRTITDTLDNVLCAPNMMDYKSALARAVLYIPVVETCSVQEFIKWDSLLSVRERPFAAWNVEVANIKRYFSFRSLIKHNTNII